jgi:hypothetical protein
MALSDLLNDETFILGLQLLAAGGPMPYKASFGQRANMAVTNTNEIMDQRRRHKLFADAAVIENGLKQMQMTELRRRIEQDRRDEQILREQSQPRYPSDVTVVNADPARRPDAVQPTIQINPLSVLQQGGSLSAAASAAELRKHLMPPQKKVQSVRSGAQDGKLVEYIVFEDGSTQVVPFGTAPKFREINRGGQIDLVNEHALGPQGASFRATMSPGEAARLAQSERHAREGVTYLPTADGGYVAAPTKPHAGSAVRPVPVMAPGGVQPLQAPLPADVRKELTGISQQRALIDAAIEQTRANPTAFSMARGAATLAGSIPESAAGRFDSDAERQTRAFVFNNVSRVINERAGAAQSAQELARLRSFLPAEVDNAEQVLSKLAGFRQYLDALEGGTRGQSAPSANHPARPSSEADYNLLPSGTMYIAPDGKLRRKR